MNDKVFEIPSTTLKEECYIIRKLAMKLQDNSIIVEVGTGAGRVTVVMALAIAGKGTILYSIDNYSQNGKYQDYDSWTKADVIKNLMNFNVTNHVRLIEGDSSLAGVNPMNYAMNIPEGIDMVYFDGAHDYEGVCKDIDAWYPHVKPGGIIAGHDFDPNCEDGRSVIKALCDKGLLTVDRKMNVRERVWWIEK